MKVFSSIVIIIFVQQINGMSGSSGSGHSDCSNAPSPQERKLRTSQDANSLLQSPTKSDLPSNSLSAEKRRIEKWIKESPTANKPAGQLYSPNSEAKLVASIQSVLGLDTTPQKRRKKLARNLLERVASPHAAAGSPDYYLELRGSESGVDQMLSSPLNDRKRLADLLDAAEEPPLIHHKHLKGEVKKRKGYGSHLLIDEPRITSITQLKTGKPPVTIGNVTYGYTVVDGPGSEARRTKISSFFPRGISGADIDREFLSSRRIASNAAGIRPLHLWQGPNFVMEASQEDASIDDIQRPYPVNLKDGNEKINIAGLPIEGNFIANSAIRNAKSPNVVRYQNGNELFIEVMPEINPDYRQGFLIKVDPQNLGPEAQLKLTSWGFTT